MILNIMADQGEGSQKPESQGNREIEDQWRFKMEQQMRELMEFQVKLIDLLMHQMRSPIHRPEERPATSPKVIIAEGGTEIVAAPT
ncbi:hypothetical protein Scep_027411 [Stephania cephalantha]|uniref:Uncharacterized protein n=1 Tax=Stephania cephalantha TaxID=152367 RepID=A0AAP0EGB4_9MAGN